MSDAGKSEKKQSLWPVPFAGLRGLKPADWPREISAGVTLAALMIPLNIGYAQVAGLPPTAGLYAAIIPLAVFALLTSSRHLVTSPDASMAGLVGAALIAFAAPGDAMRLQYALALALLIGLLFFVFWIFRLAFLANFLSRAVMAGFITGLGIEVFTNQVRKILAAPHAEDGGSGMLHAAERIKDVMASSVETEGYFVELVALFDSIPRANLWSVAIGVSSFLIVRLMKRYAPRIPGALVALALLTVLVAVFDLADKGVGVLGAIPSGPPTLALPAIPLVDYLRLLPSALAIAAILLCEGLLLVRSYSNKYGYKVNGDQMLFAYGAANVAAGLTGSLVTGNSPSRSAAMDASGAKSQLPSLVAAGTIAVVMLFFTDMLAYLPNAALAGIVANAVLSLIEVHELRELWRMRRSEFAIAAVCLLSVLALGPLRAVLIAFLLSTIDVIRRASHPETSVLLIAPDGSHFIPADGDETVSTSGLVVYRFGAPLYFANAALFADEVEQLLAGASTPVRWFVLDAEAMVDVDTTGSEVLRQVINLLAERKVTFAVSRADQSFRSWLEKYDLMELIDPGHFYPTNRHAAAASKAEQSAEKPESTQDQ
ncbi:MAG: sodium-independent anion transporter [Verrucomicrobia bacterium]|nr:MAG: sodium-independent anion transporter [Verrucomicrobiota bacterium]